MPDLLLLHDTITLFHTWVSIGLYLPQCRRSRGLRNVWNAQPEQCGGWSERRQLSLLVLSGVATSIRNLKPLLLSDIQLTGYASVLFGAGSRLLLEIHILQYIEVVLMVYTVHIRVHIKMSTFSNSNMRKDGPPVDGGSRYFVVVCM